MSVEELKVQLADLQSLWDEFRRERGQKWDPLIARRLPQHALPAFPGQEQIEVDIQSPDLQVALNQFVDIILRNMTKLDAISQDSGTRAKDDIEDLRIALAISWAQQNDGDRLRRVIVRGQQRYGFGAVCKLWCLPSEPEEWPEQEGGEPLPDYAERAIASRQQYFSQWHERNEMFGWRPVHPLHLMFFPLDKPEIYIEQQVLSYTAARNLRNRDGELLRLTRDKNIIFADSATGVGNEWPSGSTTMPKITFVRRTVLNRDTGRWTCTEFAAAGEGTGASMSWVELDEYEAPFNHSPYYVVPSGGEDETQSNPHWRFMPQHMHPLLVLTQEYNYLTTLLAERVVRRIVNPFYMSMAQIGEKAAEVLQGTGLFTVTEGPNGERRLVWAMPEPGEGEVAVAGRFEAWPDDDIKTLLLRLDQVRQDIAMHSPNRWLTGNAITETAQATGSGVINQTQNAQEAFGRDAEQLNIFVEDWLRAEPEALVFWNKDAELPKPVKLRTRGDEPVAREPRDAGDEIELTVQKCSHPYVLVASTSLETLADQMLREQQADVAKGAGAITKEQWLKRRGAEDPRKQMDELEKDRLRELYEERYAPLEMQMIDRLTLALSGVDPASALGAAPVSGETQPGAGGPQPGGTNLPVPRPYIAPSPMGVTTQGSAPPGAA